MLGRILVLCVLAALLTLPAFTSALAREAVKPSIPDIADRQIPDNEALRMIADMRIGWNLGNTFDANGDGIPAKDEMRWESAWVGVETTREMILAVQAAGFNAIRIPVSWHNHVDADFTISPRWLDRVQEVVDWAYDAGMYVILNIHHDDAHAYYYPDRERLDNARRYITTIWSQLSQRFIDYDNRLLFESVNEPRLKGTQYEWNMNIRAQQCLEAIGCVNLLNQAMVDTVRATGGNNAGRYILIPGYCASADGALSQYYLLPKDTAENRIIVSVHAYLPYRFALQSPKEEGSTAAFDPFNKQDTADIDRMTDRLYSKFVSKGVPVLIGEFGSRDKGGNLQSRVDHAAYYVRSARACGISCLWWDNHYFEGTGEGFGLLDRKTLEFKRGDIVDALMTYAK